MTTFLAITGPCGRTVICESTPGLLLIQHLPATRYSATRYINNL